MEINLLYFNVFQLISMYVNVLKCISTYFNFQRTQDLKNLTNYCNK